MTRLNDTEEFCKAYVRTREDEIPAHVEVFDTFTPDDGIERWCFKPVREAWALWQEARKS